MELGQSRGLYIIGLGPEQVVRRMRALVPSGLAAVEYKAPEGQVQLERLALEEEGVSDGLAGWAGMSSVLLSLC